MANIAQGTVRNLLLSTYDKFWIKPANYSFHFLTQSEINANFSNLLSSVREPYIGGGVNTPLAITSNQDISNFQSALSGWSDVVNLSNISLTDQGYSSANLKKEGVRSCIATFYSDPHCSCLRTIRSPIA